MTYSLHYADLNYLSAHLYQLELGNGICCQKSCKHYPQQKASRIQNSRNKERILLYYYGKRWSSIHHARMRIGCSKLNYDLCNNLHVIEHMSCSCGAPIENAQHFFLMCPLFANERQILMQSLTIIHNNVQCNDLLFGINHLSLELNQAIFHAVQEFIVKTKWFVQHLPSLYSP